MPMPITIYKEWNHSSRRIELEWSWRGANEGPSENDGLSNSGFVKLRVKQSAISANGVAARKIFNNSVLREDQSWGQGGGKKGSSMHQ